MNLMTFAEWLKARNGKPSSPRKMTKADNKCEISPGSRCQVNDLSKDLFSIYTDDKTIYIKSNSAINGTVKVYDIMGNIVLTKETNNNKLVKLETTLNTGIYIVSIEDDLALNAEKVSIK